jgi:hypothetical protein
LRAHTENGPQVARRLSDVKERREWEQKNFNPKNPDISPQQQGVIDYYDAAYKFEQERERRWKAEEDSRRAAIAARHQAIEDHNNAVREKKVFDSLRTMLWEKYGATETERSKVKLLMERNHKDALQNIEMWEVTLLKLRAELTGNVTDKQIDWRSAVGRTK